MGKILHTYMGSDVSVRFPLPAPLLEYFLYIYKNEEIARFKK